MKKIIITIGLLPIFVLYGYAQTCQTPATLGGDGSGVNAAIGQSFTACQDGIIAKVCFGSWQSTALSSPDKIQIYDSGDPSAGTPIYEVISPITYTEGSGSSALVCHDLISQVDISNSEVNSIVFALNTALTGAWGYTNDNYAGGVMYYNQNASARPDLSYFPQGDAQFKVELDTAPAPIPTMGEWALLIFGLILASAGVITVMHWQKEQKMQPAI